MKLSLPARIVLVQLIFMVALGALGVVFIQREFLRYKESWTQRVERMPTEKLFAPLAREVAWSLLVRLENDAPEQFQDYKSSIGGGLDRILTTLPGVERLVITDPDGKIQYTSDRTRDDITLVGEAYDRALASDVTSRRELLLPSGETVTEVTLPLFDRGHEIDRRRLGSVLIQLRGDVGAPSDVGDRRAEAFEIWAGELGRGLLSELQRGDDETHGEYKIGVSEGLDKVLRALPIQTLAIVDQNRRIQYINDPQYLDQGFADESFDSLFAVEIATRFPPEADAPEQTTRLILPVFDRALDDDASADKQRLGTVLIEYRPDPFWTARIKALETPSVDPRAFMTPLMLFLVVAVGSGILLAALAVLPVRRMERVLADFRERGFKGGLDPDQVGLPKDLASTVMAFSELGEKLARLDAQGKERENLLATLSKSLEDGMLALDPHGVPIAWNPAALRILGAAVGDDGRPIEGSLSAALARNPDLEFAAEKSNPGAPFELEIRGAGEAVTLARVTQAPLGHLPGETGVLLFLRDLAALRKVETHLLEAGRFAVLAHLAASLAHEIRNPLHSIQLSSAVVEQYVDLTSDTEESRAVGESLDSIKSEARRLTELLNNYLGMVRPGSESGPVNLHELRRRVIQLVDYAAKKSNIQIRLEGEEDPPVVHGLPSRLQQAILNLVLNAIQAMPDGGILTLSISSSIGVVRLTVADTGPGLAQDLADQLFDTRVTTKEGGSGLGLPLVRLIAEAHGGGVWYRSTPGRGASFTLVLPTHPYDPPLGARPFLTP